MWHIFLISIITQFLEVVLSESVATGASQGRLSDTLLLSVALGKNVDEICTVLGYYATYSGASLSSFRDNL